MCGVQCPCVIRKLLEIRIDFVPLVLTHLLVPWHCVLDQFLNFFVILFHHITISTMCAFKSINSFWVAWWMCLHFINAITFACSQLTCFYHLAFHPTFTNFLPLLLAPLPHVLPLPTPLPLIGDIVALFTCIDEELCISILKEALQHLKKLSKT